LNSPCGLQLDDDDTYISLLVQLFYYYFFSFSCYLNFLIIPSTIHHVITSPIHLSSSSFIPISHFLFVPFYSFSLFHHAFLPSPIVFALFFIMFPTSTHPSFLKIFSFSFPYSISFFYIFFMLFNYLSF
jgi:hypothetical protein